MHVVPYCYESIELWWAFILFLFFSFFFSVYCSILLTLQTEWHREKESKFSELVVVLWWHNKIHRLFNTYYSNTMTQFIVQSQNINININIGKQPEKKYSYLYLVMRFCPLIDYFLSAFRIRIMYCGRASLFISRIEWKHTNIVR